jgi:hypothetical protein
LGDGWSVKKVRQVGALGNEGEPSPDERSPRVSHFLFERGGDEKGERASEERDTLCRAFGRST